MLAVAVQGPLPVIAHCGAETTATTVAVTEPAAAAGAAWVAVIAPPDFALDEHEPHPHFPTAERARAPLPFHAYELERASGYAIPVPIVEWLRETVDNVAGMKIRDARSPRWSSICSMGSRVLSGAEH